MNRLGENGSEPNRTNRLFEKNGYWYYKTREKVDIGPFDSFVEAEMGVSEFIDFIIHAEPSIVETLERYGHAA